MPKRIEFFDGAESNTVPVVGNIPTTEFVVYANDAAYEAANLGSPTEGNAYFNSTSNLIRYYNGTAWINLVDEITAQTLTNKTIVAANNTITTAASGNLTSTELNAALDELQDDIDTRALQSDLLAHVNDTSDAHDASAISNVPSGNLAATDQQSVNNELQSDIDSRIPSSEKGAAGGVATLDGGGKVPVAQLPNSIMEYQGTWNASTNTPTLADGVGNTGDVYRVTVAGSQDLGSGSISFSVGDYAIYNTLGVWEKADTTDAVATVNGMTGNVTVDAINELTGDVIAGPASGSESKVATIPNDTVTNAKAANMAAWNLKLRNNSSSGDPQDQKVSDLTEELTPAAGDFLLGEISTGELRKFDVGNISGAVDSVNGQTGTVVLELDDLDDVVITSVQARNQIRRDTGNTAWENFNPDNSATENASGSNQTLGGVGASIVSLINAGLVSIDMIPAGYDGQKFILTNKTGVMVLVNNETGGTAANRILTGTGAAIELADDASLYLYYHGDDDRWQVVGGTGSGGSGVQGIITGNDSNAEATIGDWLAYQDAAQNTPVDANGGSPNITITRTTTSGEFLNGNASFKISKDAANRQGEGVSLLLDVPKYLRGQPNKFKLDYSASANFSYGSASDPVGSPSDISGFLYDVTNSKLLVPNQPGIFGGGHYETLVQIPSDCLQVRVVLHIATTNASAWDFFFDNVELDLSFNELIKSDSDWINTSPITIGATTTPPTKGTTAFDRVRHRQDGADWVVEYDFRNTGAGSAGTGDYLLGLPTGVLIDTDKVLVYSGAGGADDDNLDMQQALVGYGAVANAVDRSHGHVLAYSETQVRVVWQSSSVLQGTFFGSTSGGYNLGSAQSFKLLLRFPGKGLSTGIAHPAQIGLNASVVMRAYKNAGAITANTTIPTWTLVEKDTAGSFNATTGEFTVKSPGDYVVIGNLSLNASAATFLQIYKNGAAYQVGSNDGSESLDTVETILPDLKYGDIITLRPSANGTCSSQNTGTSFAVYKLNTSSQSYAPRICYIKDVKSGGTDGGTFTSGSYQTRTLNTLTGDTGFISLSSNQFTLQPGTYHIEGSAPAFRVSEHKSKIRNITDSTDAIIGTVETSGNSDACSTRSFVADTITISSAKVFEYQHRCVTTVTTDGFGNAPLSSFGDSEVFSQLKITKVL